MAASTPHESQTALLGHEAHPHRLTEEEHRWAVALRQKLDLEGIPQPETDFLLAQFAIVSKDNVEKGVQRVAAYQEHIIERCGYSMEGALSGEIPGLNFYNSKWERCIEVCGPTGPRAHPTVVFNCASYRPHAVDHDTELRAMIVDKILLFDALTADLNDVRAGCHVINHARGAGMHNFCHSLEKKLSVVSQDAYPLKYKSMPVVDAGWVISTIFRIVRPLIRKKLRERIHVCTSAELTALGYRTEDLPDLVGGSRGHDPGAYETWLRERLAKRAESIAAVKL